MFDDRQLNAYLGRIGLGRPPRRDLDALQRIHRCHIAEIAYENLDIQLGRPVSLEPEALFTKMVTHRRGGFCYEMNAVLAMALRALGFDVSLLEAGVSRQRHGDSAWGNHMLLLVNIDDQRYLVDAGLGNGFTAPLPLAPGRHRQGDFSHRLERLGESEWRCWPDPHGTVDSFDVRTAPRECADFVARCRELATSQDSTFVKVLTAQRSDPTRHVRLRARTYSVRGPSVPAGGYDRLITDRVEFGSYLSDSFGLGGTTLPATDLDVLWDKAWMQHEAWVGESAVAN